MKKVTLTRLGALGICLFVQQGHATNGMVSHGFSTQDKAVAGATTAYHFDAMVAATNPAGLAFVDDSFDANLSLFSPDRSYASEGDASPIFSIGPQQISSDSSLFMIPSLAFNYRMDDRQTLGLAAYGNGGMNTKYKGGTATISDNTGAHYTMPGTFGDGTAGVDLKQMFISGSYTYKLQPDQALGVSLLLAGQAFKAYGIGTFAGFSRDPEHLSDNGTDYSYGVGTKLGYQGKLTDTLWLGAAYQPRIRMSNFNKYSGLFPNEGRFDIPAVANVGMAWNTTPEWLLLFDIQRIFYSDVAAIANTADAMFSCMQGVSAACLGGPISTGFGWDDMTVYKLGLQYQQPNWSVRSGISYGKSPIRDSEILFNVLSPGLIEWHYSLGGSYRLTDTLSLLGSYMYAPKNTLSGKNSLSGMDGSEQQTITIAMSQQELTLGLEWLF
jgi:long-chain fatty acid transport protein